ncbi:BMP family ABC transporter substrate-binding protein [Aneurinibacillus aneurinilyticus]|uniref:BMP family ABC transporter substrate-binding protein n=1 Tax=Aneurinibacillus aneurinilyticus TaxID=1391 RepID=UPI003523E77B
MLKKIPLLVALLLLVGCLLYSLIENKKNVSLKKPPFKVALLLEGKKDDQGWDNQAFRGLQQIERELHAQIVYKQDINTDQIQITETKKLAEEGYDLIFGNGRSFESIFNRIAPIYPKTHFVFFNGKSNIPNVSAVNFTPESIGYFSGMVAGLMTKTHKVGLIPAYHSMKEIEPFFQAVKEQDQRNQVIVQEVNSWNDGAAAVKIAKSMVEQNADVLVPMGDGFNIDVIMEAHHAKRWAVGYISDQSFVSRGTIITSTVQDVTNVYLQIAKQYKDGSLPEGCLLFDFKNGGQDLAPFGSMVPNPIQNKIKQKLDEYKKGAFFLPVQPPYLGCQ